MKRIAVGVFTLIASSSCGGSSTTPSGIFAQVAGLWNGTVRIQSLGGNTSCISALPVGANTYPTPVAMNTTAQFSESGPNLTATFTNSATGEVTHYSGTAGTTTVTLNFKDCTQCAVHGGTCLNGAVRDVAPQSGSFTGTVNGSTMTGTQTTTYVVSDSSTGAADTLTINGSVTATKQ